MGRLPLKQRRFRRLEGASNAGMTLLEVVLALSVLVVGMLAFWLVGVLQ